MKISTEESLDENETKIKEINNDNNNYNNDIDTNCICHIRYIYQRIATRIGRLGNKRTSRDHPNYSIVEIGKNAKKNPGDLGRLAVT